jgi:hypothetical protein
MDTPLQAAVKAQRSMGMKGENWDNYAIARYTLEGELGLNGQSAQHVYDLNRDEYNTLLANGRQDVALALCNTKSLLELNGKISRQLRFLNLLLLVSICFLGAIVTKLYPQILGGLPSAIGLEIARDLIAGVSGTFALAD